jgi:hypothetical protein
MKKLGWSDKEREEYLRKALNDALLREQQRKIAGKEKMPLPGSLKSLLPGTGPRMITSDGDVKSQPGLPEHYEAPPEVREAQQIFESRPTKK